MRANYKIWTSDECDLLKSLYPDTATAEIAAKMGVRVNQVHGKASALGLKKSAEYLASDLACRMRRGDNIGAAYQFKPGAAPWNKGIKFDSGGRSHQTRFKPGMRPHTWRPIGTERISKDGILERKITDTGITKHDYVAVHRLAWIERHGPIPAGCAIVFRDGNPSNLDIGNLECVTRAELMRRNSCHNYGKEIAQLVQLRGAITRQINKRERKSA